MKRTFVIGDIHGAHKALIQCLERSGFNKENDTLIQLGDVVDGWSESFEVVEELLTIKNLISIVGNHDEWFNTFLTKGIHPQEWLHGGIVTKRSYINNCGDNLNIPKEHLDFFKYQNLYYIDDNNRFFVHGGFNRFFSVKEIKSSQPYQFYWDRDLWSQALSCRDGIKLKTVDDFSEIFIGHTSTTNWYESEKTTESGILISKGRKRIITPMNSGGVWNLDTGAGWDGKLTIMDVDTKEFWQSDFCNSLYKDEKGRK